MFYKEDIDGQILQEGINEAGAISAWIAAATSYSTSDYPMMPFYIFYSMFGFQRIGDLAWAAGDSQARGFLHRADRRAHDAERRGPAAPGRAQPPAGQHHPELHQLRPDLCLRTRGDRPGRSARMFRSRRRASTTSPLMNENYAHPAMPEGVEEGIVRGMYRLREPASGGRPRVRLGGAGSILREVEAAAGMLEKDFGVDTRGVEPDQYQRAAARGSAGAALEPPAPRRATAPVVRRALPGRQRCALRRGHRLHEVLRGAVACLLSGSISRPWHRRLRAQRAASSK
jgi:pyruvate dehydrogenase E1 component